MNTLQKFEAKQLEQYKEQKSIPDFGPGDTVKVNVRVKEGTRERIQAYEGVCIARAGNDVNATFTVRKISLGEGVERVFPLWSSRVDSIEVVRRGSVRRAKLYYLRDRRGKSARISERTTGYGMDAAEQTDDAVSKTAKNKAKKADKAAKREENRKIADAAKEERRKAKEAEKAAAKAEADAAETPAEE